MRQATRQGLGAALKGLQGRPRAPIPVPMLFWILIILIAAVVAERTLRPLLRGSRATPSQDVAVYKAQLAEIDADLARGTLTPEEAEAQRLEVSRRLLAADASAQAQVAGTPPPPGATWIAAGTVAAAMAGALALYAVMGAPGYSDQPHAERLARAAEIRATRPSQEAREAAFVAPEGGDPEIVALLDQVDEAIAARGALPELLLVRAGVLAELGRFPEARAAQAQAVASMDPATPLALTQLAQLTILAAGGLVTEAGDEVLRQTLQIDPDNPIARFYSGQSMLQSGRPDLAYPLWARLWVESSDDAPWMPQLAQELPLVARAAGRRLPERGPRNPAAAAIQGLPPEDQRVAIRGMVEGLADTLATEGGPPEDWAQLIRSLGVLGERRRASAIWAEAQEAFAGDPVALQLLRQAARDAEIAF